MNRSVNIVNMKTLASVYCDVELRGVTCFLTLQNNLAVEIHKQLRAVYDTTRMSSGMVRKWRRLFWEG